MFVSVVANDDTLWNSATQNGYMFYMSGGESYRLLRNNGGGSLTQLISTTSATYAANTWQHTKLTRSKLGVFYSWLNDELVVADFAGTTNPETDTTITSGNRMVFQLEAGDKICYADITGNKSIIKKHGVD